LRWRKYLLAVPLVAIAVVTLAPGVSERMLAGFSEESKDSNHLVDQHAADERQELSYRGESNSVDAYTITSGRSFVWPFVIAKIEQEPWLGYGRLAMNRTHLAQEIYARYREAFPHPHNAYLELLFDSGLLGALCVLPLFLYVAFQGMVMFLDRRSPSCMAVGGACLAVVLSMLYGGIGSQSFYPREGWVGMWCLMGLMVRLKVQRTQALEALQAMTPAPAPLTRTAFRPQRTPAVADRTPTLEDLLWKSDAAPVAPAPAGRAAGVAFVPRIRPGASRA
jgi:hypothetical protein